MLGCVARAVQGTNSEGVERSTAITVDLDELEDARWFTVQQVRNGKLLSFNRSYWQFIPHICILWQACRRRIIVEKAKRQPTEIQG